WTWNIRVTAIRAGTSNAITVATEADSALPVNHCTMARPKRTTVLVATTIVNGVDSVIVCIHTATSPGASFNGSTGPESADAPPFGRANQAAAPAARARIAEPISGRATVDGSVGSDMPACIARSHVRSAESITEIP